MSQYSKIIKRLSETHLNIKLWEVFKMSNYARIFSTTGKKFVFKVR